MNGYKNMMATTLSMVWSSTTFGNSDLSRYAMPRITVESRNGVAALSLASMLFLLVAALLCKLLSLGTSYVYTYAALAVLSLHVHLSSWRTSEVRVLHLLAMTLLVISGSALVLIAQQTGRIDTMMFASVAVLLMLVPIVPWGLREALVTVGAIYLMFTASTMAAVQRFSVEELWILQLLMLFTAFVSVMLVIRAIVIRKNDLQTQFELQKAHSEMQELSNRDYLTGVYNRRFLESQFAAILAAQKSAGKDSYFALFDVDLFKQINDTLGHERGDDVLKAVGAAFGQVVQQDEYLVRLGGDEFALLMCGIRPEERIREGLAMTVEFANLSNDKTRVFPTFSVGMVAVTDITKLSFQDAYRMADEALYEVKRAGGNRILQHRSRRHVQQAECVDVVGYPS